MLVPSLQKHLPVSSITIPRMGILQKRSRDKYRPSSELDEALAESSRFYAQMRQKIAEEDGLDPDEVAENPELRRLQETYGDELGEELPEKYPYDVEEEEAGIESRPSQSPPITTRRKPLQTRAVAEQARRPPPRPPARKVARKQPSRTPRRQEPTPTTSGAGRLLTVEMPDGLLGGIDEQVEAGLYSSRDDFLKEAVRDKLRDLRRG